MSRGSCSAAGAALSAAVGPSGVRCAWEALMSCRPRTARFAIGSRPAASTAAPASLPRRHCRLSLLFLLALSPKSPTQPPPRRAAAAAAAFPESGRPAAGGGRHGDRLGRGGMDRRGRRPPEERRRGNSSRRSTRPEHSPPVPPATSPERSARRASRRRRGIPSLFVPLPSRAGRSMALGLARRLRRVRFTARPGWNCCEFWGSVGWWGSVLVRRACGFGANRSAEIELKMRSCSLPVAY